MLEQITRRQVLSLGAGSALCGWFGRLAAQAAEQAAPKSCILLWMAGGPSHLDTFDLKPEAPGRVRGEFQPIDTAVPGIQISEHFPKFAKVMRHAALLRGMSTVESDHQLASYHVHTGYQKRAGGIAFPSLGSLVARELGQRDFPLPEFVCIGEGSRNPMRSGFLGPDYQPLDVTNPDRGTDFLEPLTSTEGFQRQYELLRRFDDLFQEHHRVEPAQAHRSTLERAVRLMNSRQKQAFDLSQESEAVRERYGRGSFGQGCLMARRLIEAEVRFVEVLMGGGVGWDTHRDNFPRTRALSSETDRGMAALIADLEERGRLDSTLIIWMGEFGRSPQITSGGGRNHWARAWSSVLAGGGIRGGQVIGRTDRDAAEVLERPISVVDFLATICTILGIDYTRQNHAPGFDRPIPIVDTSKPVKLLSELQ
ncbi:MAG TPA: DUF1501 domain-containing protein [Planctomycetaceae bacterium]|nr:DUF1501 domain-containing protein [Planctomycetaceae bacterium]